MKLVHEIEPCYFEFWGGAADRMEQATEEQREEVYYRIEELADMAAENGEPCTDTDINDYVWFDCDEVFEVED